MFCARRKIDACLSFHFDLEWLQNVIKCYINLITLCFFFLQDTFHWIQACVSCGRQWMFWCAQHPYGTCQRCLWIGTLRWNTRWDMAATRLGKWWPSKSPLYGWYLWPFVARCVFWGSWITIMFITKGCVYPPYVSLSFMDLYLHFMCHLE